MPAPPHYTTPVGVAQSFYSLWKNFTVRARGLVADAFAHRAPPPAKPAATTAAAACEVPLEKTLQWAGAPTGGSTVTCVPSRGAVRGCRSGFVLVVVALVVVAVVVVTLGVVVVGGGGTGGTGAAVLHTCCWW